MGEGEKYLPPEVLAEIEKGENQTPEIAKETQELVAKRWEAINQQLEGFVEKQERDALVPDKFVEEVTSEWKERHAEKEHNVDAYSPFERVKFLLALLVEQGAEWPPNKLAAVRRILIDFATQTLGAMHPREQEILNITLLADPDLLAKIGSPRKNEPELIKRWIEETIGQG